MINFSILNTQSYYDVRYNLLAAVEENNVPKLKLYFDTNDPSDTQATIGVGMNIDDGSSSAVRDAVLDVILYPDGGQTSEHESEDTFYRTSIKHTIDNYVYQTDLSLDSTVNREMNAAALQAQIDLIMMARVADNNSTYMTKRTAFEFINDLEVKNVLNDISPSFETDVDNWLSGIPQSQERAILFSLAWNQTPGFNPLLGPGLKAAVQNGDREEAWFEIRYNSNGDKLDGIAKRRYYEADLFKLYNDEGNISEVEAKSVFSMFTKHRVKILNYDNTYGHKVSDANQDYNTTIVKTRDEAFQPAKDVLVAAYASGSLIDEIYVDYQLSGNSEESDSIDTRANGESKELIFGESGDDVIHSGAGADVVYGGAGDDVLSGGRGDDMLYGGADVDTYLFEEAGFGRDTIDDNDGHIMLGGSLLSGQAEELANKPGTYAMTFAGRQLLLTMDGSDLVISRAANEVITIKNYSNGSFNLTLNSPSANPLRAEDAPSLLDLAERYGLPREDFLLTPGNEYLSECEAFDSAGNPFYVMDEDLVLTMPKVPGGDLGTDTGILDAIGAFLEAQVDRTLRSDPLVLDLDGDGIELIDVNDSNAFFDLDEDGFAERVGWIGGDDGMLAVDQNSNGQIDGMEEVFGNATTSGFVQLASYDTNGDGLVDASDANFADLRIWKDVNEDGVTDAGELTSLAANNNMFQYGLAA